jgi:hypothetical protein
MYSSQACRESHVEKSDLNEYDFGFPAFVQIEGKKQKTGVSQFKIWLK